MLRSIADLDPHDGHVFLDDVECHDMEAYEWRQKVALLPAESRWWSDSVGAHFARFETSWLQELGFEKDVMNWQVSRLSTGERQRLAVVRLLSRHPEVLLLDEPTANLDTENARRVEKLIEEYRKDNSPAVLWVSHSTEQIRRVAKRWFEINNGQLSERTRP